MMNTKSHLNILIPVVSLSLAFVLLLTWVIPGVMERSQAAQAAPAKTYTTNWKATRLIRANSPANARPVYIGVGEWQVSGQLPSSTSVYKETWSAPGGRQLYAVIEKCNLPSPTSAANYNFFDRDCSNRTITEQPSEGILNKYLYSYTGADAVAFKMDDAQYAANSGTNKNFNSYKCDIGTPNCADKGVDYSFGNGAAGCKAFPGFEPFFQPNQGGFVSHPFMIWDGGKTNNSINFHCTYSTGAYGFSDVLYGQEENGWTGSNLNLPSRFAQTQGVFMPLEWTVNGFVCDDANDKDCKVD